jgi:hypothetical protein
VAFNKRASRDRGPAGKGFPVIARRQSVCTSETTDADAQLNVRPPSWRLLSLWLHPPTGHCCVVPDQGRFGVWSLWMSPWMAWLLGTARGQEELV